MNNSVIQQVLELRLGQRRSSLQQFEDFLAKLGNPHQNLSNIIHVAGTNGKGSTIAYLKSLLQHAGYTVNVYTSPHLISICERIKIHGAIIEESYLANLVERTLKHDVQSFFEAMTACAFMAFQEYKADFILLETGIGGTLDPTNVVSPLCSVITSIGFDHENFLGSNLIQIAQQKAGIIKPNTKAVLQGDDPTLRDLALQYGPNLILSKPYNLESSLVGAHQVRNASLALSVLSELKITLSPSQQSQALNRTQWPGRFQTIHNSNKLWILDGAHNPSAATELAYTLEDEKIEYVECLFALDQSRSLQDFLSPLSQKIKTLYLLETAPLPAPHANSFILEWAQSHTIPCILIQSIHDIPDDTTVLVTGSLYLVGHVMQQLQIKPEF